VQRDNALENKRDKKTAKMNWTKLRDKIYYLDGSFRDIYILRTNRMDNQVWVNYVNENYRVDWYNGKTDKEENKVNFFVIEEFWNGNLDFCSTAKVFIDNIQINNHFFGSDEIENDIDPREFNSIEDHNKLIKYMSDLSSILDKEVILTPENEQETVLMTVWKNKIEINVK
jgi:hypothetical protein